MFLSLDSAGGRQLFSRILFLSLLSFGGSSANAGGVVVVINEILQNPAAVSDTDGEWFELFNPTGSDIDIAGWTIMDNGSDSHVIANGGSLLVPAGGYLVLGRNGDPGTNGGVAVDYQYSGVTLGNSADELVLLDGGLNEVDRVEWDGGATFPDPNGASMALNGVNLDNNLGANWCTASTPFGAGDLGTPGSINDCPLPEVVINEILQNPNAVADGSGEWFEVYNPTGSDIDIDGWTIQDNGSDSHLIDNGGPLVVASGAYRVLGNDANFATNGGVVVDYQYSGVTLGNSDDELVLLDAALNEIDRVEWDGGPTFPNPTGAAMALKNPGLDNNLGENWCVASTAFGDGDLGTPGGANVCPSGPAVVINEIMQNPAAVSDSAGEWFELFNPTGADIDIDGWTILDNDSDSHVIVNGGPLVVPAGGFLVLANNGDFATNGGVNVDYAYPGNFVLTNGFDELVLLDGLSNETDRVEWDDGATFPDPSGASMALKNPTLDNNVGGNWCEPNSPYGSGDFGTPGAFNDCGLRLVINEIDYDQPGADFAEFVEIKNTGNEAVDLAIVELVLVNGPTGTPYDNFPLPAETLLPGDYYVVCANASTVANCDFVAFSSIQNGSPDAVALVEIGTGVVLDTVSYEGDTAAPYTEGSGTGLEDSDLAGEDFKSISRFPDGADTGVNNADLVNVCITPGTGNTAVDTNCSENGPLLEIFQIQGNGASSPFDGQGVITPDNVVTTLGVDGFFMQTPTVRSDADVDTSDGIFVFTGAAPTVAVGDLVSVIGTVDEFFGFTEIAGSPNVTVTGTGTLPAAVLFDATTPSPDPAAPSCAVEYECYESMLVEIAAGIVAASNQEFSTDAFAEIHVTAGSMRPFREPGIEFPGLPPLPIWDGNPEVFELDADKLGLPSLNIPAGSTLSATGVIGYEFNHHEFWPSELTVDLAPLPVPVRPRAAFETTVGSLNLFRLFAGDTLALSKLSAHIQGVLRAPDILAVQEVESLVVLQDLADQIFADSAGTIDYTPYLEEGNDVGGIDVGFLVQDTITSITITQLGKLETFVDPSDGSIDILHDRPPLLLEGISGGTFPISVMALHMRSLGGIDDPAGGVRVRQKRFEQAVYVAEKVQEIQTANPNVNLVVTGDFNAFEFSDGYVDLAGIIKGDFDPAESLVCTSNTCTDLVTPDLTDQVLNIDAAERYSFIFRDSFNVAGSRGDAQILDHAMTSSALNDLVQGLEFGRGNADAADELVEDDGTLDQLLLRASDHDGLVLYILKDADHDAVPDEQDFCPNTVIPERVPTIRLATNRWALVDDDTVFDTRPGSAPLNFTTQFTGGCSCEQIIAELDLGQVHSWFGCSINAILTWRRQVTN